MQLYPKKWKSVFWGFFRVAIALWVAAFVLLYFAQERLIFPGSQLPANFQFRFTTPFDEKFLLVDGVRIDSLLFHPLKSKGLILYFHGNGGDLKSWGETGQELAERIGMDVWIFDYPGYGKSEGSVSSENQLHRVSSAFFEAAQKLLSGSEKLILYGRSIGSGLAVKLASEHRVAALILESPYTSLLNVARDKAPWAPLFLLKYSFHSDQWVSQVHSPLLILHGDLDEVIPFHQGKELAELLPVSIFVPIAGGHHNDLADFSQFWPAIEQFISHLPDKSK